MSSVVLSEMLIGALPPDGSFITNANALVLLGRKAARQIDGDEFREIVVALEREGRVLRGRGPGGMIARANAEITGPTVAPADFTEFQLMPCLQRYLEGRHWRGLKLPPDAHWRVLNTSEGGARDGQWRRSDYTGVSIRRGVRQEVDVRLHTFELKNTAGGSVAAVYEAKAQTRRSHFGHFVWYLPDISEHREKLSDIERVCRDEGIGLILFSDTHDLDKWDYRIPSKEQQTTDAEVDEFLRARLDQQEMYTIQQLMAR